MNGNINLLTKETMSPGFGTFLKKSFLVRGLLMKKGYFFLKKVHFLFWDHWQTMSGKNFMGIKLISTAIFILNRQMSVYSVAISVLTHACMLIVRKDGN